MEISFEKRYVPIYTLIVAVAHHIITNINYINGEVIKNIWPIDAIILVFTLIFMSIFDRGIKERIALGILYSKTPFENAGKYIKKDKRIKLTKDDTKELNNISNEEFYCKYYKQIKEKQIIISKNSEYCVIRDIVFTIFIICISLIGLTLIWKEYFYKELLFSLTAYVIGIISCRMKAKDFVRQIIIEGIKKKEEKKK